VVESISKPTAVKGMANTGPQSIQVAITETEGPTEAEKKAERERKEKIAQSNALPSWHLQSTVTGAAYGEANPVPAVQQDEDDERKPSDLVDVTIQDAEVDSWFDMLMRKKQAEDDKAAQDSDEEGYEGEEEEFEDITNHASSVGEKRLASSGTTSAADTPASEERPPKKVKVEEPADEADSDDEDLAFEDV
jgi:transcription initiation factor TFIIE subunit alpha